MPTPITREFVEHNGVKYFRERFTNGKEYYRASRGMGRQLLHRVLYEEAHGPIPDGWHVHHKDENGLNNALSNLQALSPSGHKLEHGRSGAFAFDSEKRSAYRRREWAQREPRTVRCERCSTDFETTGQRARFCSRRCWRAWRREHGLPQ